MSDVSSLENDLRAIEAINQRDVQFALANDAGMMSQWMDDPDCRQAHAHSSASV